MKSTPEHGLTAIEVLIGLVVAAILVGVAIPSYRSHLLRRERDGATSALQAIRAAEERFFVEHNRYSRQLAAAQPTGLALSLAPQHYALDVELTEPPQLPGFRARALRVLQPGEKTDPRCASFSLNQNGIRRASDASGVDRTDECWASGPR